MLFQVKHTQCVHNFFVSENVYKKAGFSQNISMKKYAVYGLSAMLFLLAMLAVLIPCFFEATPVAYAAKESPLYAKINDEMIDVYETEIAGHKVVSGISQSAIEMLGKKYGFSTSKTKALLVLADFSKLVGDEKTLADLSTMSDKELLAFTKKCVSVYVKPLSKERRDELKNKFLKAAKSKPKA